MLREQQELRNTWSQVTMMDMPSQLNEFIVTPHCTATCISSNSIIVV